MVDSHRVPGCFAPLRLVDLDGVVIETVVIGVLSATVVTIDHVRARLQLSELRRRELSLVR